MSFIRQLTVLWNTNEVFKKEYLPNLCIIEVFFFNYNKAIHEFLGGSRATLKTGKTCFNRISLLSSLSFFFAMPCNFRFKLRLNIFSLFWNSIYFLETDPFKEMIGSTSAWIVKNITNNSNVYVHIKNFKIEKTKDKWQRQQSTEI